ncbi:hypothetical protein [Arenimonas sp. MALMAid1274]|uniref:hypothetical protein n=1 Tax=Arenimonas sp. MALMAid1274 TaxID=3411630 RepID=UPI003B9F6C9F
MDRRFELTPLGKMPILFALGFGALIPLGVAVAMVLQVQEGRLDPMALLVIQAGVALVSLAVVLPIWRREAWFDGQRLKVRATWYTREAPLEQFDLDQARVTNLREQKEFRPLLKTNGYALPGLRAGHFRLRDRRKAFCLITDPTRVIVLPHRDGRVWLLSVQHPQAVLDILRRPRR